jgi:serine protease
MKRWVLLGLLGLCSCPEPPPPPPPSPQPNDQVGCPRLPSGQRLLPPPQVLASRAAPELQPAADEQGRERFMVRFRSRPSAQALVEGRELRVRRLGGLVRHHWPHLSTLAARLSPQQREQLARDPDVLEVVPDRRVHALGWPQLLTSASESTPGLQMVQAPQVWDANEDGVLDPGAPHGQGIKVCVIDSGIDNRHPELLAPYARGAGKDFVDDDDQPLDRDGTGAWGGGHGTHVAATIAAQLGVGGKVNPSDTTLHPKGVAGVAPGVSLLIARVLDTEGNGYTSDVIAAMQWCVQQKAHIASLSLGSGQSDEAEQAAFEQARAAGVLSIAASGNSGSENVDNQPPSYPAAYPSVLAVGAVDFASKHPEFSQTGEHLSLVAPGVGVLSATIVGSASYSTLEAGGTLYASNSLEYARLGTYSGTLVDCGLADSNDSCGAAATCDGFVAYGDRGGNTFADKVSKALFQGARAVVIANNRDNEGEGNFTLGAEGDWPPAASVSKVDGARLKAQLGTRVSVTLDSADYGRATGTSMATPHVSGVAALVWSARPSLTPSQVQQLLEQSALNLGAPGRDKVFGHGLVQAKAALERLNSSSGGPTP